MAINGPLRPTGPGNTNPVNGPDKTSAAKPAGDAKFNPQVNAPQTGATPSAPKGSEGGPNLDAIKSRVQDALDQGKTKPEILDLLVEEHLAQTLGDAANDGVKKKVADQFRNDPQLTQLFNAVYNAATKN
ncbi:MAG: hypothetical protein AAGA25_14795 [Planctomycetota bacterium]